MWQCILIDAVLVIISIKSDPVRTYIKWRDPQKSIPRHSRRSNNLQLDFLASILTHIISMPPRPAFSDLPLNKGDPKFSAWGLWGENDELGTLNFLTPEVVRVVAAAEIKDGARINLNWSFEEPSRPCFGRQKVEHKVL